MGKFIFGAIALLFAGAVAVVVGSYVVAYDSGNTAEQGIIAAYDNNNNILSNYSQRILEMAQVPAAYTDAVSKVTKEAIQGRYGAEGSKAIFQSIQEQNPTVDPSLFKQIQQAIEAGRTEFRTGQTVLIDKRRAYQTSLGSLWTGTFLSFAGYPKIDLAQYKPISNDYANDAFANGKEKGPLNVFGNKSN